MKKTMSLIIISMLFTLFPSISAAEDADFPLNDQLKLIRKIEFRELNKGIGESFDVPSGLSFRDARAIGSLVIEVDDLKLETCLKAVQARIKEGDDPSYPGDFDNSFLNELMIGVLSQPQDHARRKIAFRLKNPVKNPDISLPEDVLQTRNVMICDVGLSQNHQYVALNFWQEFVGNRDLSNVSPCFYLLDHKGNILWHQETKEISDPNWEELKQKMRAWRWTDYDKSNSGRWRGVLWYPGAVRDKKPVQSFIISNEGHVLTNHNIFGLWIDRWPVPDLQLRDRYGHVIYSLDGGADYGKQPIFSKDASRLLYTVRETFHRKEKTICISTKTGEKIPDNEPCFFDENRSTQYSIKTSHTIIKRESELIKFDWTISVLDQSETKVAQETIPLEIQIKKGQRFEQPYGEGYNFWGLPVIDEKAGRFFVISRVCFLDYQFPPLKQK